MTLEADGWLKAQCALKGLYKTSPRIDIRPHFEDDDPMSYTYVIWKSDVSTRRHAQELSIASAALMAAEKFSPDMFQDMDRP